MRMKLFKGRTKNKLKLNLNIKLKTVTFLITYTKPYKFILKIKKNSRLP